MREEAGVEVESVHILGSQPWPIGKAEVHPLLRHAASHSTSLTHSCSAPALLATKCIAGDVLARLFCVTCADWPDSNAPFAHE